MHTTKLERKLLEKLDKNLKEAERRLKIVAETEREYRKYCVMFDELGQSDDGRLTLKVTIPEKKFTQLLRPTLLSSFKILEMLEEDAKKQYENAVKDFLDCPIIPE